MRQLRLRRPSRRQVAWAVPVATIAAVAGVALIPSTASANAHPKLPARSAAQLLAAVESSAMTPLSGTVVETARLGLPSLPGADSASLSWQSLVTGSHTARVWMSGPQHQRVALLGPLAESDVVRNGHDLWTYTSMTNEVSHTVLSATTGRSTSTGETPGTDPRSLTPLAAAKQALQAIDPTTKVAVDLTQRVARQKAYTLVLTPRDTRSTVRKVTIAIDSRHFVPLRVQVFGVGARPALETGFTDVSYRAPADSVFAFRAPAGARVVKDPYGLNGDRGRSGDQGKAERPGPARPSAPASGARTIGTGWTSIVELPATLGASSNANANASLLTKLTTPVGTNGDRLLRTSLVNALLLKDGRVFLGAVSSALLEQTAAATPR